jgi:hypothetical protein
MLAQRKAAAAHRVRPVLLADLLGHADLGTPRIYTQPTDTDREAALARLTGDVESSPAEVPTSRGSQRRARRDRQARQRV